jgi:7-cyano-7-deazaguanine synthase in queuosine biosynthesis
VQPVKIFVEQDREESFHEFSLSRIRVEGIPRTFRLDINLSPVFKFSWKVDELGLDFLVICACVYAVDKIVPRAATADHWTRTLDVSIPVRNLQTWVATADALAETVSFLTGDSWSFEFTEAGRSFARRRANRRPSANGFPKSPVVSLLSGGLDSFIGAIDLLHDEPEAKMLFVSHYDGHVSGPATDQDNVRRLLTRKYGQRLRHLQVRTGVVVEDRTESKYQFETSFRSRSLIFLGLAVYAALKIGDEVPIRIPENGPIALNIPLNPSRRGACSTRTVHPFFVSSINKVLRDAGITHIVENPYRFKTKGEMVTECLDREVLKAGAPLTNSCGKAGRKTHWSNRNARACGVCVPCLLRRAALHAAGLDGEDYGHDAFSGDPDDHVDLHALMGLIYAKPSLYEIKKRLIANGRLSFSELTEHASVVERMLEEVTSWVRDKGSAKVRKLSAVRRLAK